MARRRKVFIEGDLNGKAEGILAGESPRLSVGEVGCSWNRQEIHESRILT